MTGLLREALVALTYPPMLTLLLCVLAVALALLRWRRLATLVAVAGIAWSAVWSVPQTSEWLRRSLEDRHPVLAESTAPRADAIVVLGGGGHLGWAKRPGTRAEDLPYSRLAAGARLWFAGRAPVVILSGGGEGGRSEARSMAWAIRTLGVPSQALLLEQRSTDTLGNAVHTAELARRHGVRRILLVTSAIHMPRAQLLFRRTGLEVVPMPVPEPRVGESWVQRWIPRPRALRRSGSALKEYVALLGVRLSGHACPRENRVDA
jgi:uncharacterized SAM-binding protein YcdF (DUF218 family)